MEKLSDFFHDIKDRATNPLISSFIITWFIWNWRIPVGLIFLDSENLAEDGYTTMIDFVQKNISGFWRPIGYPLLSALIYTFSIPVLKMWISAFITYFKTRSSKWNLKISGTGTVPGSLFVQLREEYEKKEALMAERISKEAKTFEENIELKNKNERLIKEFDKEKQNTFKVTDDYNELYTKFDIKTLNGYWNVALNDNGTLREQLINIKDGEIFSPNQNSSRIGSIQHYCVNLQTKKLSFLHIASSGKQMCHLLKFDDSWDKLIGFEDGAGHIEYTRVLKRVSEQEEAFNRHQNELLSNQESGNINN